MYDFLPVFLMTCFIRLTLTAPSSGPNAPVECYIHPWRIPPNPDDCIALLEVMSHIPDVRHEVNYGRNQPPPGDTPIYEDTGSCRLVLRTAHFTSTETESFRLVQYFPAVYRIIQKCFGVEGPRYTFGIVDVGEEHKFVVHMGSYNDRTVLESKLNDTATWIEGDDIGAAKKITTTWM